MATIETVPSGTDYLIRRVREQAGCTALCDLSGDVLIMRLARRFTHNGVRFSRSTDVDAAFRAQLPDGGQEILTLWCQEHHAGRPGTEITIERDGQTQTLLIPEAVD